MQITHTRSVTERWSGSLFETRENFLPPYRPRARAHGPTVPASKSMCGVGTRYFPLCVYVAARPGMGITELTVCVSASASTLVEKEG
jgi:hypothetical protein